MNRQSGSELQAVCGASDSVTGFTSVLTVLYGESGPRSLRLSWMSLRALLAKMSVYSGHDRATNVT